MKAKRVHFCMFIIFCLCFACSQQPGYERVRSWMAQNDKIKVLATIGMVEDIVKQVGAEQVDTLTLVTGELDPHTYQLVKGDDEKLAVADIIFYNGLGLEHGPSLRSFLADSPKAVGLGNLIMEKEPNLILHYNGAIDPHIWMDISLFAKTIPFIVTTLSTYDPAHALDYQRRGTALMESLLDLHQTLKEHLSKVPEKRRFLVTSHDAFNYFARAYLATDEEVQQETWQKRFAAPEGLAPESQLSTTDIRLIIEHMKTYDIQVIFPESNVSQSSIRKLMSAGLEEGIKVRIVPEYLYGDAMGPPGSPGESYAKMITHNVNTIAKYLIKNGQHKKEQ